MKVRTMVVGIDGSDGSRQALEWASSFASQCGAEVWAVHAVGLLAGAASGAEHRAEADADLAGPWTASARATGVPVHTAVRDGSPVSVVLDLATELDADLIVVGTRGRTGRALLGSTAHQIIEHAHCPVIVIPGAILDGSAA